jgi:ferredoxin
MTDYSEVSIDDSLCFGHGRCYATAPEVFEADEDGRGRVRAGVDVAAHADAVNQAIVLCPESAIDWGPAPE